MTDIISLLSLAAGVLTLIVTCLALYFAWRIPHQIMVNQCYSDLVSKYNSYEMGEAIRAIFDFYEYCCDGKFDNITERYKNRYYTDFSERAEKEYKDTLHAKRRLVDQYFWFIGDLVFGKDYLVHLPKRVLRHWFTNRERLLLAIIMEMNKAEEEIRAQEKDNEQIPEKDYSANISLMWHIRKRLFAESQHWRKS